MSEQEINELVDAVEPTKWTRVKARTVTAKNYVVEHKVEFGIGAVCLIVGAILGREAAKRTAGNLQDSAIDIESIGVIDNIDTTIVGFNNTVRNTLNNVVITQLERRMHPGNMILWVETGIALPSQNMMAEAAGVTPTNLSRYLRGLVDSEAVGGQTFVNLGEMTGPRE